MDNTDSIIMTIFITLVISAVLTLVGFGIHDYGVRAGNMEVMQRAIDKGAAEWVVSPVTGEKTFEFVVDIDRR